MLVATTRGEVTKASPAYSPTSAVGWQFVGKAWSEDGRALHQMPDVPPSFGLHRDHEHCLDRWTRSDGWRRLSCLADWPRGHRFHYHALAWSRDGNRALLNSGTIIDRDGSVVGRGNGYNGAFGIHWR
jgi:hypothetical protein